MDRNAKVAVLLGARSQQHWMVCGEMQADSTSTSHQVVTPHGDAQQGRQYQMFPQRDKFDPMVLYVTEF